MYRTGKMGIESVGDACICGVPIAGTTAGKLRNSALPYSS